ncbi:MAG: N-formylglutamate deformylase [Pseudomonadota bacterium]
MTIFDVVQGDGPIVLGLPHAGTAVPDPAFDALNQNGRLLSDTDWHVDRLYEGLLDHATTVRAKFHRYVIDPNRDPSGQSLYPGQNTTSLVPLTDFDGKPIWSAEPEEGEIKRRLDVYHAAYHNALDAELQRVRDRHGIAILYDCHSIRSTVPRLFDGTLPDFNIGTNEGVTCAAVLEQAVKDICEAAPGYSTVVNGRFKGGWTTRHYGRPAEGLHAIQMELAQSTYLQSETEPWAYDPEKAGRLRRHLRLILETLAELAPR